jgi:hypothetical protein
MLAASFSQTALARLPVAGKQHSDGRGGGLSSRTPAGVERSYPHEVGLHRCCMEGFGQITEWLPREGQHGTRLARWIRWRLRLGLILSNRISSQEHNAPDLGWWTSLALDTAGCTAPSVIASSDTISASTDTNCGVPMYR